MIETPLIVPGGEPFYLPGNAVGCLLLHGFTSMPEEMRWLGDDLAARGYTVSGVRLAGHGTRPSDLARTRWQDWLVSVEAGLARIEGEAAQKIIIGQSMGGMIGLVAASRYPIAGLVALSTPYAEFSLRERLGFHLGRWLRVTRRKAEPHPVYGVRKEAAYPAYAEFPVKILLEVVSLQNMMAASLAQIKVPVLLIQSRADVIPADSLTAIYAGLATAVKKQIWLDDFDHSLVRDPKRQHVFDLIAAFINQILPS